MSWLIRLLLQLPMIFLMQEGLRRNGVDNVFILIISTIIIMTVYDLSRTALEEQS